jgi:alpha-ketoglutarate-dependent taurine dioxygenase
MKIQHIFPSWGSVVTTSHAEFVADTETDWAQLVLDRNLIVLKGFGPGLTDDEYFDFGKKFGTVWTIDDYRRPHVGVNKFTGIDPTIVNTANNAPVSYFKSDNNRFRDNIMGYHADMAHIGDQSYPGRALYMTRNTLDGSGVTTWLNLELGWEQCTEQEKVQYATVEIANHNMYLRGQDLQVLPFVKTNPKTGKISPRLNSITAPGSTRTQNFGWINHIRVNGIELDWDKTTELYCGVVDLLESKTDTLYDHHWDEGDIIVYDNWFNMHKRSKVNAGTPGGRLLRRLTFNF